MRMPAVRLGSALVLVVAFTLATTAGYAETKTYSDAKLDAFVVAAIQVSKLIDKWQPRINAAANDEEAGKLAKKAKAELDHAIAATDGITVTEYQEIAHAARNDKALRDRIRAIAQKKQAK